MHADSVHAESLTLVYAESHPPIYADPMCAKCCTPMYAESHSPIYTTSHTHVHSEYAESHTPCMLREGREIVFIWVPGHVGI